MVAGDELPDLVLTGSDDQPLRLRDAVGAPFVIYFYPKDDTSGCTREAQDFSALMPDFVSAGARVLGVSRDGSAKHRAFAAKHALTVPLASDEDNAASLAFGVWVEKSMYGKQYMGTQRATFLFDAAGKLATSWPNVRVPGHAAAVLEAVRSLA